MGRGMVRGSGLAGFPCVPTVVIGHSLGGRIIQHLMANRRFPAVVLLAPIPGRYPARVILANALRHPAAMTKVNLQGDLYPMVATRKLVREVLFTPETPEDIVSRCHRRLIGACPRLFREMASSTPPAPIAGTSTLLLAPGEDKSFTVKMQRRLAASSVPKPARSPGPGTTCHLIGRGARLPSSAWSG